MKSTDLSIKAYMQARKRLDIGYKNYIMECNAKGQNTVILYNDAEPFAATLETIFWAMTLYDRFSIEEKNALNKEISGFMRGLKFIINEMKHSEKIFETYDFSYPGFSIAVKVNDSDTGPVFEDIQINATIVFAEANDIVTRKQNEGQKRNYNKYIKGKALPDIMNKLDLYMHELFASDLWNEI